MDRAIIGIQVDELEELDDDLFLQMMKDVKWGCLLKSLTMNIHVLLRIKGLKIFTFLTLNYING